jgi:hypothetical protein
VNLLALPLALLAQPAAIAAPPACPRIAMTTAALPSGHQRFAASLSSPATEEISYNWSVSTGYIEYGQGTAEIGVVVPPGEAVTATLLVGGLAAGCPDFASHTVEPAPAKPRKKKRRP